MLKRIKFIHVLTLVIIILAGWLVHTVMTDADYKDSNLRVQIVSQVLLAFATGVGYWYGSTNGSARKTELIAQAQPVEQKEPV